MYMDTLRLNSASSLAKWYYDSKIWRGETITKQCRNECNGTVLAIINRTWSVVWLHLNVHVVFKSIPAEHCRVIHVPNQCRTLMVLATYHYIVPALIFFGMITSSPFSIRWTYFFLKCTILLMSWKHFAKFHDIKFN